MGKDLATCETLPLSSKGIICIADGPAIPPFNIAELSRDQAYLYRIINTIKTGCIGADLLHEKPGVLSHARWLTTVNRICRLYVVTEESNEELRLLTRFVVQYYEPIWFLIKSRSWCIDGSNHFLAMVKLLQQFPAAVKSIIWPVIQRNSYWGHHENVLLAMLADSDRSNRVIAVERINTIRLASIASPGQQTVRVFQAPKVKEDAVCLRFSSIDGKLPNRTTPCEGSIWRRASEFSRCPTRDSCALSFTSSRTLH